MLRQEPLNRIAYFFGHLDWSLELRVQVGASSGPFVGQLIEITITGELIHSGVTMVNFTPNHFVGLAVWQQADIHRQQTNKNQISKQTGDPTNQLTNA